MHTYLRRTGPIALLLSLAACIEGKEQCIADCDAESTSEAGSSETGSSETGSSETGGADSGPPPSAACEAAMDAAGAFVEANRACETVADCRLAPGICSPESTCGSVALTQSADTFVPWETLSTAVVTACGCETSTTCGATVTCTDAGQCEAVYAGECEELEQNVQTYLEDNRSCEQDEDCQYFSSQCYVDDCESVTVNRDADESEWQELEGQLLSCDRHYDIPGFQGAGYCNILGDCGYDIRCSDEGQCTPVPR